MQNSYKDAVLFLESLQIMPKTMPGLEKVKKALNQTDWFNSINPAKVIVVAGTNGKGSTCATLEALLLEAHQKVGFYSSPHLISTYERMRICGQNISETDFLKLFNQCENLIISCELSHFEALTLMAGHYFFSKEWNLNLDYIIFEVGLGGTYDATNAFPHNYSVITPIDFDHTQILGHSLIEIAKNKFGIIHLNNQVIHQCLDKQLIDLKNEVQQKTQSQWIEVDPFAIQILKTSSGVCYYLNSPWGQAQLSLIGERAAQNSMTALTAFKILGFDPSLYLKALGQVKWPGRMQKINWPNLKGPVYLSGDHNQQGIKSLLEILSQFSWNKIFIVVGIGIDKAMDDMLNDLCQLKNVQLCLTETPFKGNKLNQYSEKYLNKSFIKKSDPIELLNSLSDHVLEDDLVVITGSLYLVGQILSFLNSNQRK